MQNCRLGFVVDFLSHATIVGFMSGAATVVCLQQLKGILGLVHFTHDTDLMSVMHSVFSQTHLVINLIKFQYVIFTVIKHQITELKYYSFILLICLLTCGCLIIVYSGDGKVVF